MEKGPAGADRTGILRGRDSFGSCVSIRFAGTNIPNQRRIAPARGNQVLLIR